MRLSLDHITVADATPPRLVEAAVETGCQGICLFLHPMEVLPAMPPFDILGDTPDRRQTLDAMRAGGIALDLAYPFTLAGRTEIKQFEPLFETVAVLGGRLANVLVYDRVPERRREKLFALANLAAGYGIDLAIEFYPPSQIPSVGAALAELDAVGHPGIGVTADLLHLTRSGDMPSALPLLGDPRIRVAQLADGPAEIPPDLIEWEAGLQRQLPGTGVFEIAAFVGALAEGVPVSVEVPQEAALAAGVTLMERARNAVDAARRQLGKE